MGHVVDSLDYNRVHDDRDYRIREYLKALPYLDLDNERAFGKVDASRVEELEDRLRRAEEDSRKIIEELARSHENLQRRLEELERRRNAGGYPS